MTGRRRRRRPSLGSREKRRNRVTDDERSARDDNATPNGTWRVTWLSSRRRIDSFGDDRNDGGRWRWWWWWMMTVMMRFSRSLVSQPRPRIYERFALILLIEPGYRRTGASGKLIRYTSPSKSNGRGRRFRYPHDSLTTLAIRCVWWKRFDAGVLGKILRAQWERPLREQELDANVLYQFSCWIY